MSSITEKKRLGRYIAHTCSHCGHPVVKEMILRTYANVTGAFEATEDLDGNIREYEKEIFQNVRSGINLTIYRYLSDNEMIMSSKRGGGGRSYNVRLDRIDTPCPICGHLEQWQSFEAPGEKWSGPESAMPIVFEIEEEADRWCMQKSAKLLADCTGTQSGDGEMSLSDMTAEAMEYARQIRNTGDDPRLTDIKNKLNEEEANLKSAGAFGFGKKSAAKANIEKLNTQLRSVRDDLNKSRREAYNRIIEVQHKIPQCALSTYGQNGKLLRIVSNASGLSWSYFPDSGHTLQAMEAFSGKRACPKCGKLCDGWAAYCSSCGSRLDD